MTKIHVNSFVKRQTSLSEFSNYNGDWEQLQTLVTKTFAKPERTKPGYRNGVVLVSMETPRQFLSAVVELEEGDILGGIFKARRGGEFPRKSIQVTRRNGEKLTAVSVDIVLYASTVLAEDGDNELPAEEGNWEIISINASPCEGEMPIDPGVLMHNHFGSDGGTETGLSDEDFVQMLRESFVFWKNKAMIAPKG